MTAPRRVAVAPPAGILWAMPDTEPRLSTEPEPARGGWTKGRLAAVGAFCAMAGLWIYGFSPLAPSGHPDRLDDRAFVAAARPVCVAALTEVAALPQAGDLIGLELPDVTKRVMRAEQIETSTAVLQAMVDELAALAPTGATHDARVVAGWLADWEVYLGDRLAYAADFRNGIDGPFRVTKKDDKPITTPMDGFADANQLQDCRTPLDV